MTAPDAAAPRAGSLDARLRAALIGVAVFGGIFAVGAGSVAGVRAAASVATGAAIALFNLYGLARILGSLLGGEGVPSSSAGAWGFLAFTKIIVLFGGIWLLLTNHVVDPIPLLLGWGALPLGIALGSVVSDKTDPAALSHDKSGPPPGAS